MKKFIINSLVLSHRILFIGFTLLLFINDVNSLEKKDTTELKQYATKKNFLYNVPKIYGTENASKNIPEFSWSNVVIFMLTYDNPDADKLIQAQFDTWIRRIEDSGLDIVVVTDTVDTRETSNVLPDTRYIKPTVHLYRSSAPNEGNRARAKTVDAFEYCESKFGNDPNKLYYVKVDPDQFLLAKRFEDFLKDVHKATYSQPADFGNVNCNNEVVCYTMGGLYGISRAGLQPWVKYIKENPSIYDDFIASRVVPDRNLVLHEDFFTSYVFHKATGYPTITDLRIGLMNMDPIEPKKSTIPPEVISFHPVKNVHDIYVLEKIFYNSQGNIRETPVVKKLFSNFQDMFDFTKMVWDYKLGKMVMPESLTVQ